MCLQVSKLIFQKNCCEKLFPVMLYEEDGTDKPEKLSTASTIAQA